MNQLGTSRTPWHLWVVGIVSLLWHCVGAMDYVLTKLENRAYIASMTEPMGVDADTAIVYFTAFPLWMNIAWALGVWGTFAGSVLLLMRSRYAFHSFAVALIGLALASYYQLISNPFPGLTDNTIPMIFTAAIIVITIALTWYSRRQIAAGVLR